MVDLTDETPAERELSRATRQFLAALEAVDRETDEAAAASTEPPRSLEWRRRRTTSRQMMEMDQGHRATKIEMTLEFLGSMPLEVTVRAGEPWVLCPGQGLLRARIRALGLTAQFARLAPTYVPKGVQQFLGCHVVADR